MRRTTRLIVAAAALVHAPVAIAAEIDLDALCDEGGGPGTDTIDPIKLSEKAFGSFPLSLFRRDDGSVTGPEIFQALVDASFCGNSTASRQCTVEEADALRNARQFIRGVSHDPRVTITRVAEAPATHEWLARVRAPEPYWGMLDEGRRFVTMTCHRSAAADEGEDSGMAFLLTKDVSDLTLPRGGDDIKGVPQAEISYVDDNAGDTETFQVHGTAGVRFALSGGGFLIPFVQFVRSHVEDTSGANPATETSKLGVGLVSSWRVARFDRVELSALYAHDLEDGNEIIEARLGWRPGFLYGLKSFRHAWHFCGRSDPGPCRKPWGGIKTDFMLLATAGHVLDVGDDPQLVANRDFLRAGAQGRVTVFGSSGIVDDMSVDVGYRHLFGLAGNPSHISSLTAGLSYWIGGSPHVSLRFGYEKSRDEQTLERTDQWSVALGARF